MPDAMSLSGSPVVVPNPEAGSPAFDPNPEAMSWSGSPMPEARSRKPGRQGRPLVAHLEAGLRSFDRTMPEELNRLVTDALADVLWTPSPDAEQNLIREGIAPQKIRRVGNIMIDSLEMLRGKIENQKSYLNFGLKPAGYGVVTLHRPSNVDNPEILKLLCENLRDIATEMALVFPVHPRTRKNLVENGFLSAFNNNGSLHIPEPLPYVQFMNLVFNCAFVITDSGGIQEEASGLGKPTLVLREVTERPEGVQAGVLKLVGSNPDVIVRETSLLLEDPAAYARMSRASGVFGDGNAAARIVKALLDFPVPVVKV